MKGYPLNNNNFNWERRNKITGNSLINTVSGMSEEDKAALREALGVGGDTPTGPDFNGHEYVDLGLPSGTLWATMNVGATKPEEYGNYYAWGEVETKDVAAYTWENYKFGTTGAITKYNLTDHKMSLDLEDDAAHVVLGGDWHIPSKAQIEELAANTTSSWTADYNRTGVAGTVLASNINGNAVFFPAAGGLFDDGAEGQGEYFMVWSSSRYSDPEYAQGFDGDNIQNMNVYYYYRYNGVSIRGVIGELNVGEAEVDD